jgi:hypothetical protein
MRMRTSGVWSWLPTAALALGVGLSGTATAEIWAWRTEDGGYAFTDDAKAIPPRYRDQAEVRPGGSLRGYQRFTPRDDGASRDYAARLAERLEHLRELNAAPASEPEPPAEAAREGVTLRTGRGSGVDITSEAGDEPVVVETVFMRRDGSAVVQPVRVTRRGDRILAIEKPRNRQWNINDFHDEADLERELVE